MGKKPSRDDVRAAVQKAGLPALVLDRFDEADVPPELEYMPRFPGEFFGMTDQEVELWEPKMLAGWMPVLSDDSFGTLIVLDSDSGQFLLCDAEESPILQSGPHSWPSVMLDTLIDLHEDMLPPERIVELGQALGVELASDIVATLPSDGFPTLRALKSWLAQWRSKLDAGS